MNRCALNELLIRTFDPVANPAAKVERVIIEYDEDVLLVRIAADRADPDSTFNLSLDLETMTVESDQ